jgi:SM-20-related protein
LRQALLQEWEQGRFHKAGIGRGAAHVVRHDIRGDHVLWLDECEAPAVRQFVGGELEQLRLALNAAGYFGLYDFAGHFAVYPPGTGYARHLDRFRNNDARVVSLVLYLNDEWLADDGGELRLYPRATTREPVSVLPLGGTLAVFLSADVPHEVLAARRERFSLTGWFRRRI